MEDPSGAGEGGGGRELGDGGSSAPSPPLNYVGLGPAPTELAGDSGGGAAPGTEGGAPSCRAPGADF
eukprot:11631478-Alexandrium_andersonii.AAC.1